MKIWIQVSNALFQTKQIFLYAYPFGEMQNKYTEKTMNASSNIFL